MKKESQNMGDPGDILSQVYVIHKSGIVIVERRYRESCIDVNSQLLGGFLTSLTSFIKEISTSGNCKWDQNQKHRLQNIGMTCAKWFVEIKGEYILALLCSNDSPLLDKSNTEIIDELISKIFISFIIFNDFSYTDDDPKYLQDFSEEFSLTIDNLLLETVSERLNIKIELNENTGKGNTKRSEIKHE